MQLIIFSGLPGLGKSTLAESAAHELHIPVFVKDWLEASLRRSGLDHERLGYAAYDLLTTLARRQLMLGQSVILDSVATFERVRAEWRSLAAEFGAAWRVIECICSDETLHRTRLESRQRGIPGWHELSWPDVERVKQSYEAWQEPRLIVDFVEPLADNLQKVLHYLRSTEQPSEEKRHD